MIWHSPWAFLFLIPLFAIILWNYLQKKKKRPTLQFSSLSMIAQVPQTWRTRLMPLPYVLKILAFVFAIIALARPQSMHTKTSKNVEGIDIVIALDVSDSMLIEDMPPQLNRLESAKETIQKFIEARSSDRIGLVIFSGEAYTRIPLTLDYPLILETVRNIETSRNIKMGTALGVALANASARLKNSNAKSRVVIFMTDGENNSGTIDPETALEIAKGYQLKIYSIGIGRDGETQIPVFITDPLGNKIKRYQPFTSTVNEDLLGRMATETGGKFYRASTGSALEKIFSEIDRLEKTKVDINKYTKYTELYFPYLAIAVVLYILSYLLSQTILRRVP